MEVEDYSKLTRDQLRAVLGSKKTMNKANIRAMKKEDILKELERLSDQQNQENQDAINRESNYQLRKLFPFDKTVFSEYKEVGDVLRDTIHTGNSNNIQSFLNKKESDVFKDIYKDSSVKIYFSLTCEMKKEGTEEARLDHLTTTSKALHKGENRKSFYETVKLDLINRLQQHQGRGSGFRLNRIIGLRMYQTRIRPLSGSKYIELPDWIKNKKAVINIQNKDNKCFMWCILAHLFPVEHNPARISNYKDHISKVNFDGFEFPFQVKDVDKFEKRNNLAINILVHNVEDDEKINSYKVSKKVNVDVDRVVNLLLVTDNSGEGHYCLIKNIDRLMNTQNSRSNKFCIRCHNNFYSEEKYENHLSDCMNNSPLQMIKPSKDYIEFDGIQKTQKQRYVCYADFESVIYKIDNVSRSPSESWNENFGKHVASAFCVVVVDSFTNTIYDMKSYIGYDTILKFNEYILEVGEKLLSIADMRMQKLTFEEVESFHSCESCPACGNKFCGDKVRDHDHWTGLYRGPLCNACNLLKCRNNFIPVFFHNLKGYDSHLIISDDKSSELLKERGVEIKSISANIEKFISFSYHLHDKDRKKYEIRFLDSLGFMPSSLDYLSGNLEDDECIITKKYYNNEHLFHLMRRKGIYPYDFMDSFKKYSNTELPPIEDFYNSLSGETISNESYEYAQQVWKNMSCQTLEDYTRTYMINDVLLLADVFETFRNVSLKEYKLDPCWYYTSPGLAWDAMLYKTGVKLQTIKDVEMYNLIEKGIRGGMCNAMLRYSKANNKYMSNYNPAEISKYLLYLDANNLYGWAMSQKLPYDEFEFINAADFSMEMIENLNSQGKGCILEVDLDYPDSLHDKHNDLPFCSENKRVGSTNKLINDFSPKRNYVIHYKNLLQAIQQGLSVVKKEITFNDYKNCLENRTIERKQQTLISSSKHEISSVRQNKVVLNNIIGKDKETKRYFVDNINSLAFGHYRIKN
ncbi:Protein CBG24110 [Caenorhabditis briggsae]|uniref:Protein CBG24110 n=1 Tax=Caenorhabditis briggsae TaxID=6238 RepID=A8WK04_CAEBR|nr:Protein CBG24110 [Caenorhabditis briggsae]CAP20797.2 Protein CBG24110 [Caenorhabditis briggsae]